MFASELRQKSDQDLVDLYDELKEELYRLRLNHATGELIDTSQFRKVRRDIARIRTVMRERELAAMLTEEDMIDVE
jgi:large subunit ribosomal protein L29